MNTKKVTTSQLFDTAKVLHEEKVCKIFFENVDENFVEGFLVCGEQEFSFTEEFCDEWELLIPEEFPHKKGNMVAFVQEPFVDDAEEIFLQEFIIKEVTFENGYYFLDGTCGEQVVCDKEGNRAADFI